MFVIGLTGSIGDGQDPRRRGCSPKKACRCTMPTRRCTSSTRARRRRLIEAAFPGTTRHGRVDRTALASSVVGDPPALRRLEAIVHPLVRAGRAEVPRATPSAAAPRSSCSTFRCCSRPAAKRACDAVVVVSAPARDAARARAGARRHDRGTARGDAGAADAGRGKARGAPISSWIAAQGFEHARAQVRADSARGC